MRKAKVFIVSISMALNSIEQYETNKTVMFSSVVGEP